MGCAASAVDVGADVADPRNTRITRVPAPAQWKWPGGITADELGARRAAFWETAASSGRPVVWQALRVAADALLLGDVELASSILAASAVTVPRGDLGAAASLLAFDALGAAYDVPRFLYATPGNVLSAAEAAARAAARRPPPRTDVVAEPLALVARLAATAASAEQDVPLALRTTASVADVADALDAALASGKHDAPPDESNKKPNAWAGQGLPAARQRIMFR